jgi:alpha-D-xyloside xylohydrolase
VDFTNPEARKWYAGKLRGLLDMGVDCFKTDFGERIPVDVIYSDGSDPHGMHNYYTYLYNKCVYDTLREVRGEGDAVVFGRSATAGVQQFPVQWGGDNSASYPSMAETLRGGLSFLMSGFSFWSHDIGGFEATAEPDLYKRWLQFGLFSSHSRLHGSQSPRVPWNFDDQACEVAKKFVSLKCRLMPYIYAAAVEAHETGVPFVRAMPLEFCRPDGRVDPACEYLDMQYMFGPDILVAPIFNAEGRARYYLPEVKDSAGASRKWTHLLSGEKREGGRWYEETYDYFSLPVFVRPGAVIPFGSNETRPDYDYTTGTEFRAYELGADQEVLVRVPDLKGKTALTVSIRGGAPGAAPAAQWEGPHDGCTVTAM